MRPKSLFPKVYHHQPTGQDAVVIRGPDGKRRTVYLGRHGSPDAQQRYREVLADHLAGKPVAPKQAAKQPASTWPLVAQLIAAFLLHARRYYVAPDGTPSREIENLECAVRMLAKLRGNRPTDRITVRDILEVRQALIDGRETHKKGGKAPDGLSRRYINALVRRMKAVFRWGVEQRMVPATTWHELSALRGIPAGRAGVPDHPPVEAVPWSMVEPILPFLAPTIRDAVLVQWWSGMRPAETLALTRRQLDTTGSTWLYRVAQHKGSWRGRDRTVALGPKAQAILLPRLSLAPDTPVFSGRAAWNERRAAKRLARKTPSTKQMVERDRRGEKYAETVAEHLRVDEYRRAIHHACDRAGVPRWSPHRLRHAAGTRIAREIGIEAARAALGHTDVATTRRYATGADAAIAADVAQRLG